MRFAITHPMHSHPYNPELVTGAGVATMATAAEAAGFSGFGFTDHPAPTQRWLDAGEQGDFRAYRDEARKRCLGLTELWTQPFQAEYRAKDGSRALVRCRIRDGDIQYGIGVIPK